MGKCDYCKMQNPNRTCGYHIAGEIYSRSYYCDEAIEKMEKMNKKDMAKCNFCEKSTKSGECDAEWDWEKEKYCKKAIARMMKAGRG